MNLNNKLIVKMLTENGSCLIKKMFINKFGKNAPCEK